MRTRRIIPENTAIYHCMSRTVNGEAFFKTKEKEILRKMIAQVADFSGVQVLTYCVMNNHFHVLVKVSPVDSLPDAELMRRFRVLYPKPTRFQTATAKEMERALASNGETADLIRQRLLARMADVSQFMKTLKQRFSIWFNKSHDRFGPVWSDRFKSVLVEGHGFALQTVAAYIDLNPVRAGIVDDPKDYRFCGYAEAVAGESTAQTALGFLIFGEYPHPLAEALQGYRQLLFGKGSSGVNGAARISDAASARVLEKENGVLPPHVLLRCRIRYFTEGAVIGSAAFVESHIAAWQEKRRRKNPPKAHKVPDLDGDLTCVNRGKQPAHA